MKNLVRLITDYRTILILTIVISIISCNKKELYKDTKNTEHLHDAMNKLTNIIVYDIFSPPVASRIYVYPIIAAYEAIRYQDMSYKNPCRPDQRFKTSTLSRILLRKYLFSLAGLKAFIEVAKELTYSENKLLELEENILNAYKEKKCTKKYII